MDDVRVRRLATRASVIAVAVAAMLVIALPPDPERPAIRSDGLGYHAWVRAIVEGDLGFCRWRSLRSVDAISARNPHHRDRCQNKYPPGLALLRLPLMAPFVDTEPPNLVVGEVENRISLWLGGALVVLTAALVLACLELLGVGPLVANATVLAATFGTGLFHYGVYDGSFTHVYSAAMLTALVWLAVRAARRGADPPAAAVAALGFLVTLVRPPDLLVLAALAGGWLAWRVRPLERWRRRRAALRAVAPLGAGVAAALAVQLLYNRWASGAWAISSYGDEPFSVSQLRELSVLFSYERGLFVWYPVLALLLAVALWRRAARGWALTAVAAIVALTVLYGSWHSWYLGGGFGHRGFVEVVPLVAIAGAIGLAALPRRPRSVALALACACTFATVELTAGYWRETVPIRGATKAQYWSHVTGRQSLPALWLGRGAARPSPCRSACCRSPSACRTRAAAR